MAGNRRIHCPICDRDRSHQLFPISGLPVCQQCLNTDVSDSPRSEAGDANRVAEMKQFVAEHGEKALMGRCTEAARRRAAGPRTARQLDASFRATEIEFRRYWLRRIEEKTCSTTATS